MYTTFLHKKVAREVVLISTFSGYGTGVHINGLILTNNHVCGTFPFVLADGQLRKVLRHDDASDLCLVQGLHAGGLVLGVAPSFGDTVLIIGHPLGLPLISSEGLILKEEKAFGFETTNEKECAHPYDVYSYGWCMVNVRYLQTSVQVFSGSSGSPVVDALGRLVGLVMIKNEASWAGIIPLSDIRRFLAK